MAAGGAQRATGAATDLRRQPEGFRETHPVRRLNVGGLAWEYLTGGAGDSCLVLLSGGGGVAESGFRRIARFEPGFRVIAPSYPAQAQTMACLVAGLEAILEQEGAASVHLHGHSLGGALAQCFVRPHPQRVRSMVLANIGVPSASRMRKALYPAAQVHTFKRGGHLAGALQREAYDSALEAFLRPA